MFRITAKEYAFIADIDTSVAYKQLKEGAEELQVSVIRIPKNKLIASVQDNESETASKKRKFHQMLCVL